MLARSLTEVRKVIMSLAIKEALELSQFMVPLVSQEYFPWRAHKQKKYLIAPFYGTT